MIEALRSAVVAEDLQPDGLGALARHRVQASFHQATGDTAAPQTGVNEQLDDEWAVGCPVSRGLLHGEQRTDDPAVLFRDHRPLFP